MVGILDTWLKDANMWETNIGHVRLMEKILNLLELYGKITIHLLH